MREVERLEPLSTRIVPVKYADVNNLKENLAKFLSGDKEKKRGTVLVDEHTKSLIIQATRGDIDMMISLVEALDKPPAQIRIEAHIVEASRDTARELGIQWGGLSYFDSTGERGNWLGGGAAEYDGSLYSTGDNDTTSPTRFLPPIGTAINFPAILDGERGMTIGYHFQEIGKKIGRNAHCNQSDKGTL